MSEKTPGEILKDKLIMNKKHAGLILEDAQINESFAFCEQYKAFLDNAKTEREAVNEAVRLAKQKGFAEFERDKKYSPGDKIYCVNRGKSVILAVIGQAPANEGVRIAAAHIDSPRLDLKPNPLYEDSEFAMFKTHYYGGIKKYQWVTLPLALHGTVIKKDGTQLDIVIGEDADDPCFVVTDLLPHLSAEQNKKTLAEAFKGESLNILIGSLPFKDDKVSERVKLNIMRLLNEKYGFTESDFISAEIEAVPRHKASDIGFDRSMIGAYGHDDRVCAYPALRAVLDCETPPFTAVTILADKEEVGSDGNTGLHSRFFQSFINDLALSQGTHGYRVLGRSLCLSADVNVGHDPNYPDVLEKNNAARLGYGAVITKYTGSRGKSDTSDASAEYVGRIRKLFEDAGVLWQTGELGRVDMGGGGTVAKYIANLDVDTVDIGVPVLSMHSPFEVVSKLDVKAAYDAFAAFYGRLF
ncbi:MAG TPA: aminopeptidase [Ruminococcaceae bacterium]|nr:aminopeptidase [Oscillospiraceae bacterium]